jgi:hypothetical protein
MRSLRNRFSPARVSSRVVYFYGGLWAKRGREVA